MPEKYDAQYVQLAQTLGAEVLMEAAEDEEDDMSRSANSQLISFRISILLNLNKLVMNEMLHFLSMYHYFCHSILTISVTMKKWLMKTWKRTMEMPKL